MRRRDQLSRLLLVAAVGLLSLTGCERDIVTVAGPEAPEMGSAYSMTVHPSGGVVVVSGANLNYLEWIKDDGGRSILYSGAPTIYAFDIAIDGTIYLAIPDSDPRYSLLMQRSTDGTLRQLYRTGYNGGINRIDASTPGRLIVGMSWGGGNGIMALSSAGVPDPRSWTVYDRNSNLFAVSRTGDVVTPGLSCYWMGCSQNGTLVRVHQDAQGSWIQEVIAGTAGSPGSTGDGGPASAALVAGNISSIDIAPNGDIYFLEDVSRLRKISGGIISTVAGNGLPGFSGDGQPGTLARIYAGSVAAFDGGAYLYQYLKDGRHRIRKLGSAVGPDLYVALGDSYAAGTGAGGYDSTSPAGECDRTQLSWQRRIAGLPGLPSDVRQYSCVGANSDNITHSQKVEGDLWIPSQLTQFGPSGPNKDVRVVTLTIGGNDLGGGLKNVITSCVLRHACQAEYQAEAQTVIQSWRDGQGGTPALSDTFESVLTRAPAADLWVVGYPHLFTSDRTRYPSDRCGVGDLTAFVTYSDAVWLNSMVDQYYSAVEYAMTRVSDPDRVHLIDLRGPYSGNWDPALSHELCGGGPDWIHGLAMLGTQWLNDSFHPNAEGHANTASYVAGLISRGG